MYILPHFQLPKGNKSILLKLFNSISLIKTYGVLESTLMLD